MSFGKSHPHSRAQDVSFALAFQHPYVLVFGGPHFVEIRNVETGSMSQVIQGNNIHCLFTNTPPSLQQAHPPQFFVTKKELHVTQLPGRFGNLKLNMPDRLGPTCVCRSVPGTYSTVPLLVG
jgi:hypothetical protein